MKLQYTSTAKIVIQVTLDVGETLVNFIGPTSFTVPVVDGNKEYDYIKSHLMQIDDYVEPVIVPYAVTPLQARKILRLLGYIDQVEALIAEQSAAAQDEWKYASVFERNNPLISEIGDQLDLDASEIDHLFIEASKL